MPVNFVGSYASQISHLPYLISPFPFLLGRPAGPPCVLLLYAMVHHRRPSMTRCLPAGSDLTRDYIKEEIRQDVDMVEELDAASIVLIVLHILITSLGLACYCTRSVCAPPAATLAPALPSTAAAAPQTHFLHVTNTAR